MLPVQFLDTVPDMSVVVLRQVLGLMVQNTVVRPQLLLIGGRLPSFVPQRQIPMVHCSADHRDSSDAVRFSVVDAPVVQLLRFTGCSSPYTAHCLVRQRIHAVRQFTEFSYFLRVLVDSRS